MPPLQFMFVSPMAAEGLPSARLGGSPRMAKQSPNRLANRGRLTLSRFHRKGKIYAMATELLTRMWGAAHPSSGHDPSNRVVLPNTQPGTHQP